MEKSVLFVDQFGEVTGGQVVLQTLVKVAQEQGYRVGVLAPRGGGLEKAITARWADKVELHDLRELSLRSGKKGFRDVISLLLYCIYALKFLRLVSGYNVVYVNGARLALPFFLVSLLALKPRWIYHVHLCHSGLEQRILNLIANSRRTSQVVMASSFIFDDFVRRHPAIKRNPRVCVVENCLNPPFSDLAFADRFSKNGAPLTVALVGRVSPVKGHDVLPRLARRFPDMRFLMIGRTTNENRSFLESVLSGAPANLSYVGETANLPELLDQLSIHISLVPSRWEEPFGLVSIETMAASCITLVSNRGMLPHIAASTGAFCFRDDDELVAMLERLRNMSPPELSEWAARQYAKVRQRFGFDDFRRKILNVLEPADPHLRNHGMATVPKPAGVLSHE